MPRPGRFDTDPGMLLLNPKAHDRYYPDERSREIMRKTIEFFETRGKRKLKADDRAMVWYQDFLDFVRDERIFATLLTPSGYGQEDCRWDTWRMCEFGEILAFYGLHYWYTWQVSILGLGPIWMSDNEALKQRAARMLEDGEIFAFGLSEKEHGADVYSSDMMLVPQNGNGDYLARGDKYYIGNANAARMVSTFGRVADSDGKLDSDSRDFVFFVTDSQHERFDCRRNVVNVQSYVADFEVNDYPISEADILSRGPDAWNAALNTVNVGKFNLGWASIGICTHAYYEAINHASSRNLYGTFVSDFPHVRRLFTDAYSRLVTMKLVGLRAADYMRSATREDRRYLLYNPIVKMKVTTEGEKVINDLWDVIAAKGFENDMYFEMAARDIRALPKLEGTVHVNIALTIKFMANYFFGHEEFPAVETRNDAANDDFLFDQGPTSGLSAVRFHDPGPIFAAYSRIANVALFSEQIEAFKEAMLAAPPGPDQMRDLDFLMAVGEIFVCIAYAQLLLENAPVYETSDDLLDQIFEVLVRDLSDYALKLQSKPTTNEAQADKCTEMIRRPVFDAERYERVWAQEISGLKNLYEMNP